MKLPWQVIASTSGGTAMVGNRCREASTTDAGGRDPVGCAGVRVGFEDNVYLRKGQLAASNAELVADIAGLTRQLGRAIATSDQARQML
jgi:hypothetical protein